MKTSLHPSLMEYAFVKNMERNLKKKGKVPEQMARDWNAFMQGVSKSLFDMTTVRTELVRERQAHDALDIELEDAEQRISELEEEMRMEKQKNQTNEKLMRELVDKTSK